MTRDVQIVTPKKRVDNRVRPEHDPEGDPCTLCGVLAAAHRQRERPARARAPRPEHVPTSDPCTLCGLPAEKHRLRTDRPKPHSPIGDPCAECGRPAEEHKRRKKTKKGPRKTLTEKALIGFDGEGQNTPDGRHVYTYAAAVDETGYKLGSVENLRGLDTEALLAFLVELAEERCPEKHSPHLTLFGFSLGYDLTKILEDLPDMNLWKLCRPESRAYHLKPDPHEELPGPATKRALRAPVIWEAPKSRATYSLDYQRSRFTVRRIDDVRKTTLASGRVKKKPIGPSVTLWDGFSFFACSFVSALEKWSVGTPEERERILDMKLQRGDFEHVSFEAVKTYCDSECALLGQLMRKLIDAHAAAGLVLRDFYGAGSSGGAMLKKWNAKRWLGPVKRSTDGEPCEEMRIPMAQAYFAGRFECSRVGPIEGEVFGFDVSSAYPYAMACGMPCLEHGKWTRFTRDRYLEKRITEADYALVRAQTRTVGKSPAWGPLPWRLKTGDIIYPLESQGSWVWRSEYLAVRDGKPWRAQALEAWIYEQECICRPFEEVPAVYSERVRLGKDAAGLVLKLGLNSCYGKTAQSVGSHPFQSWVWAGMITASTRAQLLTAIAAATDPWSVLMTATDGLFAREDLKLPKPEDTGTFELRNQKGELVPLGGWERKSYKSGIFIARPGVYFPLVDGAGAGEEVRARGVGRRTLAAHKTRLVEHWRTHEPTLSNGLRPFPPNYAFEDVNLFVGMVTGVLRHPEGPRPKSGPLVLGEPVRSKSYGRWIQREQVISFAPQPKRADLDVDTKQLTPWRKPLRKDGGVEKESSAYGPAIGLEAVLSEDALRLRATTEQAHEQPHLDVGFGDEA